MQLKRARQWGRLIEQLESRRLLSAGALDTSFSGDGKATAGFPSNGMDALGLGMTVQSDGKIVEVGNDRNDNFVMVRYNANGTLDTSFGIPHTGKVALRYGSSDDAERGFAVAIQSDNKIVVAASTGHIGAGDTFDILRFNSNGTFDTSFGSGGKVNVDVGFLKRGSPTSISLQKDGKIVVAGTVDVGQFGVNDDFLVVRLNANGSLDGSFGTLKVGSNSARTGQAVVDFGENDRCSGLAIDYNDTAATNPDYGRIVVAGSSDDGSNVRTAVARLNANGTLDSSFSGDGKRVDSLSGEHYASADAVVIVGDGYVMTAGGVGTSYLGIPNAYLLRSFTPKGDINTAFGTGGVTETSFNGGVTEALSIINGFTQRLIVGGNAGESFGLAAYTLDGKLDPAFGNHGKVTTSFSNTGVREIAALALGPNRTIVGAGGYDFSVARYFDIGPTVAVTTTDSTAGEPTFKTIGRFKIPLQNPGSFIVSRDQRLPFATRVFFTIGGTANAPTFTSVKTHTNDYTLDGMTVALSTISSNTVSGFVDIPANEVFATVTLTPVDDTAVEPTEKAIFSIQQNALYDITPPPSSPSSPNLRSSTISILDNDSPAGTGTTLNDTADAYVRDGTNAGANFGTAADLEVKNAGSGFNRVSYIKFDLSSVSTINSVKLNLFGKLSDTQNASITTSLFSVADTSWSETGITFNNAPALGSSALASATITGTTLQMVQFDVTSYVKAQKAAGHNIVSFALKDATSSNSFVQFNSREAGAQTPALAVS